MRCKSWRFQKNDDEIEKKSKAILIAHADGTTVVKDIAGTMFDSFVGGNKNATNKIILDAVLMIVPKHGGQHEVYLLCAAPTFLLVGI